MNVTVAVLPKQIGSVTATEFVPPVIFGLDEITNESVIVPAVTVVEHEEVEFVTVEILIVDVPAFVSAEAGMVKVPTPPLTTTALAVCVDVLAPEIA